GLAGSITAFGSCTSIVESVFGTSGTFNALGFTSNPILDILKVFAVVFTETVMSILLSTILDANKDENLRLKPLKLLSSIRFLAVESFTPLLKTSKVVSKAAPLKTIGLPALSTNLGIICIAVGPF